MYVGEYAEQDAALTLKLWQHFKVKMRQEEVESIFDLETEVLPTLLNMTQRGIRFDRTKAEQLIDQLQKRGKRDLQRVADNLWGRCGYLGCSIHRRSL
jgi:DNA polymerase I-like protein with 3'-5' exonuclease and polymerase domains